jgi:hypothetical protein
MIPPWGPWTPALLPVSARIPLLDLRVWPGSVLQPYILIRYMIGLHTSIVSLTLNSYTTLMLAIISTICAS